MGAIVSVWRNCSNDVLVKCCYDPLYESDVMFYSSGPIVEFFSRSVFGCLFIVTSITATTLGTRDSRLLKERLTCVSTIFIN